MFLMEFSNVCKLHAYKRTILICFLYCVLFMHLSKSEPEEGLPGEDIKKTPNDELEKPGNMTMNFHFGNMVSNAVLPLQKFRNLFRIDWMKPPKGFVIVVFILKVEKLDAVIESLGEATDLWEANKVKSGDGKVTALIVFPKKGLPTDFKKLSIDDTRDLLQSIQCYVDKFLQVNNTKSLDADKMKSDAENFKKLKSPNSKRVLSSNTMEKPKSNNAGLKTTNSFKMPKKLKFKICRKVISRIQNGTEKQADKENVLDVRSTDALNPNLMKSLSPTTKKLLSESMAEMARAKKTKHVNTKSKTVHTDPLAEALNELLSSSSGLLSSADFENEKANMSVNIHEVSAVNITNPPSANPRKIFCVDWKKFLKTKRIDCQYWIRLLPLEFNVRVRVEMELNASNSHKDTSKRLKRQMPTDGDNVDPDLVKLITPTSEYVTEPLKTNRMKTLDDYPDETLEQLFSSTSSFTISNAIEIPKAKMILSLHEYRHTKTYELHSVNSLTGKAHSTKSKKLFCKDLKELMKSKNINCQYLIRIHPLEFKMEVNMTIHNTPNAEDSSKNLKVEANEKFNGIFRRVRRSNSGSKCKKLHQRCRFNFDCCSLFCYEKSGTNHKRFCKKRK